MKAPLTDDQVMASIDKDISPVLLVLMLATWRLESSTHPSGGDDKATVPYSATYLAPPPSSWAGRRDIQLEHALATQTSLYRYYGKACGSRTAGW